MSLHIKLFDHAEAYVNGQIHTDGLENFWSLLKRSLHGTYIAVEPYHLFRHIVGRRVTYKQLTVKQEATDVF